MPSKKQQRPPISIRTKWFVWNRTVQELMGPYCTVCSCQLSLPESLRSHIGALPFQRSHPVAQFGHVLAWSQGGSHDADNLVLLCPSCNMRMGSMHMDQYVDLRMDVDADTTPIVEVMDTSGDAGYHAQCLGVCISRDWAACKNPPLESNFFCTAHLSQRVAM